jgi:hypothetical protein
MDADLAEGFCVKTEWRPERRIQHASEWLRDGLGAKRPRNAVPAGYEAI